MAKPKKDVTKMSVQELRKLVSYGGRQGGLNAYDAFDEMTRRLKTKTIRPIPLSKREMSG